MRHVRRPGRRRRHPQAADLRDQIHIAPGVFQALCPAGVVVDDPLGKRDRAYDRQPEIANSLAEILERAAAMDMVFQFADPGLDRLIAGLSDQIDQFGDRQILPAQRARVQPKRNGFESFATPFVGASPAARALAAMPRRRKRPPKGRPRRAACGAKDALLGDVWHLRVQSLLLACPR